MRDSGRIQERSEVRLDRRQAIWATLGVVVALCLSFALGVVVGRRVQRVESAASAAVADPLAEIEAEQKLHDMVSKTAAVAAPSSLVTATSSKGPLATASKSSDPTAAPSSAAAAPANVGNGGESPASGAIATHATGPTPKSAPGGASKPSGGTTPEPDAAAAAAGSSSPTATGGPDSEVRHALAQGPAARGEYTVQVSAFQSREEAKAFASSLERKGFRPFVVESRLQNRGTWYRVRLGRFASQEQAERAKQVLGQSEIAAWVLKSD